ncbi:hypothetical protein EK21DRAFT_84397 [Setomelanomma holmii]|uniref:Uncharacterized protein n=1 Tax=Setomelanomma holmii TaxID=210430 RepID=A0A9P4HK37_9PLEO|nr:hypothetical protein EK21DRAFT_84397 [Setomelanomma holmii]
MEASANDHNPNLAMIQHNNREPALLRLPGELRNRVYGYVLGGANCVVPDWELKIRRFAQDSQSYPFAILEVCLQTYQETSSLPFSLNNFEIQSMAVLLSLPLSKAQKSAISSIRLEAVLMDKEDVEDDVPIFLLEASRQYGYTKLQDLLPGV